MNEIYYFIDGYGIPWSTRPKLGYSYEVINHRGWSNWDEVIVRECDSDRVIGSYVGFTAIEDLCISEGVAPLDLLRRI